MQVRLTKKHAQWLRQQIAAGRFQSLEEGLAVAIDSLKGDEKTLDWAMPLVAEGLAELDRRESTCASEIFE